jgi:hypothetical protein
MNLRRSLTFNFHEPGVESAHLTPALSPQRAEREIVRSLFMGVQKRVEVTMNLEFEDANRTSPSPLNGERAGVRGENGPARFLVPTRVRIRRCIPPMNLLSTFTFNIQLMQQSLKVERSMLNVESSRRTHPGSLPSYP